jgi:hypothetical protein
MAFKFKWKRITDTEAEKLTRVCNLSPMEQKILEMRRKGVLLDFIGYEIGYGRNRVIHYSKVLLEKILKEL